MSFRRGFKAEAKAVAAEVRVELGVGESDPLDPWHLAAQWGIPVHAVSEQVAWGCHADAIRHFHADGGARFSAALIPDGFARVILENDAHAMVRRRANIAHEMAHVILEHDFGVTLLTPEGCRAVNKRLEDEAAWLAGELLVPTSAAIRAALVGCPDAGVASGFQVSEQLARWRMNASGARTIAKRARRRRGE